MPREARWCKRSEDRVSDLVETFRDNLRRITKRLAYHDQCDTIDVKQVDEAFDALSRSGLRRRRWWNSPELKTTCGTACIALAFAVPDFLPYASLEETAQSYALIAIVAALVWPRLRSLAYFSIFLDGFKVACSDYVARPVGYRKD